MTRKSESPLPDDVGGASSDVVLPPTENGNVSCHSAERDLLSAGKRILNSVHTGMPIANYFLMAEIGIGGNGVVFRALDQETAEEVAIKFFCTDDLQPHDALLRYQAISETLRRIQHPALVHIRDIGTFESLHFLVMDLFVGPFGKPMSLRDYTQLCSGRVEELYVQKIFLHLLDAMSTMHRHGILHADLKPENILFRFKGSLAAGDDVLWRVELKLTDFGLVTLLGEKAFRKSVRESLERQDSGAPGSSDTQSLLQTVEYMSPQQKRGEPATVQTDIYAMGLMLYQMLVGAKGIPLQAPSRVRPGTISEEWDSIVACATHEHPDARYNSAADMAAAIASLTASPPP